MYYYVNTILHLLKYTKHSIDITPFTFFTLYLRRNQLQTLWHVLF
nr:MAG TPA: hypothetical protein [Microviridae sp.]